METNDTNIVQTFGRGNLDTSAQLRKTAAAKGLTTGLLNSLIRLNSPLKDAYRKTIIFCATTKNKVGDRVTSSYCNQRWCYVCNRIRTAKLIDGYAPVLLELPDLRFVTLTRPNCHRDDLRHEVGDMVAIFRKVREKLRKRGLRIDGVRKMEVTTNEDEQSENFGTFHPHFHLIISGQVQAESVIDLWLQYNPDADRAAQKDMKADRESLKEVFKYCTKMSEQSAENNDWIFQCLKGLRLVQPMGHVRKVKVSEDIEELQSQQYAGLPEGDDVFVYVSKFEDWVSTSAGYLLCEYFEENFPHVKALPTDWKKQEFLAYNLN